MKAEDYTERNEDIDGWPVHIVTYRIGDTYLLHDRQRRPRRAVCARRGPDARGGRARRRSRRRGDTSGKPGNFLPT